MVSGSLRRNDTTMNEVGNESKLEKFFKFLNSPEVFETYSPNQKDSYSGGFCAIFAYMMNLFEVTNEDLAKLLFKTNRTITKWKAEKPKTDIRKDLVLICLYLGLGYVVSARLFKLLGYSLENIYDDDREANLVICYAIDSSRVYDFEWCMQYLKSKNINLT